MPRTHHVYLVPGFFGFANLGQIAYFGHVRRALREDLPELGVRAEIHVVRTPATGSLPQRAARLAETIAETARGGGPIHVIGHSSGGLDARLLAAPGVALPTRIGCERFLPRVRSIVTLATPHHGTPLASSFATLRGQRLLQLLSLGTIHVLHVGRLPIGVMLRLGGILARTGDRAAGSDLFDELFGSLLADFSVGRRRAIRALLHDVVRDQALLLQLTPEAMDLFGAAVRNRPGIRYGCVVTEALPPGLLSTLAAGLEPAAQATHAIYGALYRLASATPEGRIPALTPSASRVLSRSLGAVPSAAANDGIVPTRSQIWGRILQAVRADHLDVLGHFRDGASDPPHVDWLTTGSRFGRRAFDRVWHAVARFLVSSAALALLLLGATTDAQADVLRAGAAVVSLPAPPGGPLGGYGGLSDRRAQGMLDPPQARALVLEQGTLRIGIVSLDVVIVRPGIRAEVAERTRALGLGALLLVATHTHSGPGGFVEGWLGERLTAGSFDPAMPEHLAAAAANALEAAAAVLEPARLGAATGSLDLARNRRHAGGPRETALPVLALTAADGRSLARLFSYGVHAVALGPASHDYSADLVGVARTTLDGDGGVSLFLPGPLGDQNPMHETLHPWPDDVATQRLDARSWGAQMAQAVRAVQPVPNEDATLTVKEAWADVPPVSLRRGSLLWWLSPLVGPQVKAFVPKRTLFQALRLGDACLLTLPAEPATALGDAARRLVPAGCVPFVIAHANDWLGYALTPEDYAQGGYEADLSIPGAGFGAWLLARTAEVARGFSGP